MSFKVDFTKSFPSYSIFPVALGNRNVIFKARRAFLNHNFERAVFINPVAGYEFAFTPFPLKDVYVDIYATTDTSLRFYKALAKYKSNVFMKASEMLEDLIRNKRDQDKIENARRIAFSLLEDEGKNDFEFAWQLLFLSRVFPYQIKNFITRKNLYNPYNAQLRIPKKNTLSDMILWKIIEQDNITVKHVSEFKPYKERQLLFSYNSGKFFTDAFLPFKYFHDNIYIPSFDFHGGKRNMHLFIGVYSTQKIPFSDIETMGRAFNRTMFIYRLDKTKILFTNFHYCDNVIDFSPSMFPFNKIIKDL